MPIIAIISAIAGSLLGFTLKLNGLKNEILKSQKEKNEDLEIPEIEKGS